MNVPTAEFTALRAEVAQIADAVAALTRREVAWEEVWNAGRASACGPAVPAPRPGRHLRAVATGEQP